MSGSQTRRKPDSLSLAQARRIALAAQGFGEARPAGAVTQRHLSRALERTSLLQIDSVNVVSRAHYLPLFSRLGAYPRALLDEAAWGRPRRLFEYWAHEASLLPLRLQPLLRWRMERARQGLGVWGNVKPFAHERRSEAEAILERIRKEGPLAASDLDGLKKKSGGWWGWSEDKRAVEWLFWSGFITTATRRNSFERVYDLTERVLPQAVVQAPTPSPADAHRALLRIAARSLGVATAGDLRDYFRQSPGDAKPAIETLVEDGALVPVKVEGWSQAAYLDPQARMPRRIDARALLVPFDPLIWDRSRTERLFCVRVRLEIYTPAHKREHGYYVLPFLLGDRIVGRMDLKSDRAAGVLRVQSAHAEPDAPADVAEHLAAELRLMAGWLGLEAVAVEPRGDLAGRLARTLAD
ncbi:MAG: cytoplasmic protein [Caulobacteraceae bacterium]|nr:cytoplasmic protein [Caulobacteraceae bacterium]